MDDPIGDRFWAKVAIPADVITGCWLWTAFIEPGGYGRFARKGRSGLAHRIAFEFLRGSVPDGLQLDHLCRVRHCVNPAHLQPVTNAENCRRGLLTGNAWNRGEKSALAKLTEVQVLEIRRRYSDGGISMAKLGAEFGVTNAAVFLIVKRKKWAHLAEA